MPEGPDLIAHLERYLGSIGVGWSADPEGEPMPFQIVRFDRGGGPGRITFATWA